MKQLNKNTVSHFLVTHGVFCLGCKKIKNPIDKCVLVC